MLVGCSSRARQRHGPPEGGRRPGPADSRGRAFSFNGRPLEDYFPNPAHRRLITEPLRVTNTLERYDIVANLGGGGISGQAGALRHGISRALVDLDVELRPELKKRGFLTRDAREVERKKYGLKKARKAPQYSKR